MRAAGLLAFANRFSDPETDPSKKTLESRLWPKAQIHCVFFGCPRSSTRKYVQAVIDHPNIASFTRVNYEDDIVTKVPPDWAVGGYTHVPAPWVQLRDDVSRGGWRKPETWVTRLLDVLSWLQPPWWIEEVTDASGKTHKKLRTRLAKAVHDHNMVDLYKPAIDQWIASRKVVHHE